MKIYNSLALTGRLLLRGLSNAVFSLSLLSQRSYQRGRIIKAR